MTTWLLAIYLLVTVVLLTSGIIRYKPNRPIPSAENKDAARRILLSWLWPIQLAVAFTRWWMNTFERLWIDAQFMPPSWLKRFMTAMR